MKTAFAQFSSVYQPGKDDTLFDFALPPEARNWGTDGREPATTVGYFAGQVLGSLGVWKISRIRLHWAGSDMEHVPLLLLTMHIFIFILLKATR